MSTDSENTNEVIALTPTAVVTTEVVEEKKKRGGRKAKELTVEQVEAKKKLEEEKAVKKAAREKERADKKAEREKQAEQKKKEKEEVKKKKAKLALQEALDKTNGFKLPTCNTLFNRASKRKFAFMTYVYEIINELSPELLKDLSVRIAYNNVIEVLVKHSNHINTYNVADNHKYNWFSKKHSYISITDIEKTFIYSYFFTSFSANYYIPNGRSLVKGTEEYKLHCNNIKEVNDTYIILYDMIYPVLSGRCAEKGKQVENARIVAENKARIKAYKDSIIQYRANIKAWKEALKKLDVEGTTYNELFGEGVVDV